MTAPLYGEARPTQRRWTLGSVEITAILDGLSRRDGVHPTFGNDRDPAEVAALGAANRLPVDRYVAGFIPVVVNTGTEVVLFDTGLGSMGRGSGSGHLLARLPEAGYPAEAVDVVVLTHAHPDHIAGLMEGEERAFPNARYVIGRAEYDGWTSGERIPPSRAQNRELFLRLLPPLAAETTLIEPGATVAPGITAVAAFGHSVGHVAFMIEGEGRALLLWGDTANHFVFSVQRPEWRVGFDDDKDAAVATRLRILEMAATDAIPVLGYHMPFPGLGFVERTADGYRFAPATVELDP